MIGSPAGRLLNKEYAPTERVRKWEKTEKREETTRLTSF